MLPAEAYTAPDVLAWERRHLFAASWTCLGRSDELRPGAATALATVVGDVPVLLTWSGAGGTSRAFANTCRHRGHELLADGSSQDRRALVCPYHAWSYDLAGGLIAAPGFREVATFDPDQHGLVALPLEVWHGWVFVNATASAVPFADHVGALDELVSPYDAGSLVARAGHSYDVAANWKVLVENYHECYHCPLIHPELCEVSPPTSGSNYDLPGAWVGGSMDLRDGMTTMSLDGASQGRLIAGADRRRIVYAGLFPNLLVSLHPDYVLTHLLTPVAPDRTHVECTWLFPDAEVDPAYAVDFWDLTNRQDWSACESVQRGLASPHFRPGPLAPNEDAVHQWVRLVGNAYRGVPPHVRL
jgi:Rieske 2Fe-2S family protein